MYNRYTHWLSSGLAARKLGNNTASNSGGEWAVRAVPDDFIYVSFLSNFNSLVFDNCANNGNRNLRVFT